MKKIFALIIVSMLIVFPMLIAGVAVAETATGAAPFTIDLTKILEAVITLLAALITYRLVPWIKSRTTENQQILLQSMVRTLVFAAEQLYGAGHGQEKFDYVCDQLKQRGYTVDRDEIEATVYTAFKGIELFPDVMNGFDAENDEDDGDDGGDEDEDIESE